MDKNNNNRLDGHRKDVILVTGATGNVGRHVVSQLAANGYPVRAFSRNPPITQFPPEVEVVHGDLLAPGGIEGALSGIGAVFLLWRSDRIAAVFRISGATSETCSTYRVSLVVRNPRRCRRTTQLVARVHVEIERLIENSGLEWTFLRPGAFSTNSLWWWAPQIRSGEVVRWPYGEAVSAPIHERDIAAVAVRALTEDGHAQAKCSTISTASTRHPNSISISDCLITTAKLKEFFSDPLFKLRYTGRAGKAAALYRSKSGDPPSEDMSIARRFSETTSHPRD
jgi:NAD(P)H-binding